MTKDDCDSSQFIERINDAKSQLGDRAVILAHHYQSDEIVDFADYTGDSLKLARIAAECREAEYIIFCGVHFMAESADILTDSSRKVLLPHLGAGCPMADMATGEQVALAMDRITAMAAGAVKVTPITYVNSSAAVKAVTGRFKGSCCTSGNAAQVVKWAFDNGADKIFAAPDQHLIRATALDMGYSLEDCAMYDPRTPDGGLTQQAFDRAKFILWAGECTVHQIFTTADVAARRQEMPGVTVMVHPECEISVVQAADLHGSTQKIIEKVTAAPAGSSWAIGTEDSLVARLAADMPDKTIVNLSKWRLKCMNMQKIKLESLAETLEDVVAGRCDRQIVVEPKVSDEARFALETMISN